jgi:hypothetical protein
MPYGSDYQFKAVLAVPGLTGETGQDYRISILVLTNIDK